jgi:hypothetical protein
MAEAHGELDRQRVGRGQVSEECLQIERSIRRPDDRLSGDDARMAEQAIIDDRLAEDPLGVMQPHRQDVVVIGRFMQPIAFANRLRIVRRLLGQAPGLPQIVVGLSLPDAGVHRRPPAHGESAAVDGDLFLSHERGREAGEDHRAQESEAKRHGCVLREMPEAF